MLNETFISHYPAISFSHLTSSLPGSPTSFVTADACGLPAFQWRRFSPPLCLFYKAGTRGSRKRLPITMLPPYGIKLAVHTITTDFGSLVAKVCDCLLRRGSLGKLEIAKFTEIPQVKVKQCLWVLIQHNCVQAFAVDDSGGHGESKGATKYMALFDNIIHRIRFSKFLAIVSRELDEMSVKLFEGLLEHGRLTLTQILDRARAGSNEGFNEDLYRESFTKLVHSRYVEHCPAPEPLVQLNPDEENPSKKRRSRSSKIAQKEVTTEVRALIAATPMEAERFSLVTDAGIDIDEEKGRDESIGGKRKRDIDDGLEFSGCLKEPIWRVNFEEFIRCLRNKVCIEATRAQLDDKAGIVLSAMLESSKCKEHKVSLSLDGIFEEVMKNETGRMMTLEHVKTVLAQLGCHSTAEELYTLDLKNIIKLAQNEEVESIVLKRYGRDAYKMFRLLAKSGQAFDTDKISDTVFVDKKDTTKTLSMLWKDNYLHMEKVNVAGPRLTEIIYWRVNKGTLQEQVLDELYHAGLNLILRGTYEREKEREVTCLVQEQLVGEARKRYSRLIKVGRLLYSATMKLDDAIMLFHDF